MVYGNQEIKEVYYNGVQIQSIWLGNTKVFGGMFMATVNMQPVFLVDGVLRVLNNVNGIYEWAVIDTGVSDLSYTQHSYTYYLKDGLIYQLVLSDDRTWSSSLRNDLGTGWTALYNDKFKMYLSSDGSEGYSYTLGIRNSRVIGAIEGDYTSYVQDWADLRHDPQFTKAKKVLTDYKNTTTWNGNKSIIDNAYLLTTDGELWHCNGQDVLEYYSKYDFSGKVTDIRREGGYVYCICNKKKYRLSPDSSNPYTFVKDMQSSTFPVTEYGAYTIQNGVIYRDDEIYSETAPSNFYALSGGDYYFFAITTDGKVYSDRTGSFVQYYPNYGVNNA